MFRRNFLASIGAIGAVGSAAGASDNRTVTYRVKGFSCVTCAVGLDTMMSRQKGVVHAKSSYADATTTIEFKPAWVSEDSLKAAIAEMGFSVGK